MVSISVSPKTKPPPDHPTRRQPNPHKDNQGFTSLMALSSFQLENSGDPPDFANSQSLSYWNCVYFLMVTQPVCCCSTWCRWPCPPWVTGTSPVWLAVGGASRYSSYSSGWWVMLYLIIPWKKNIYIFKFGRMLMTLYLMVSWRICFHNNNYLNLINIII